MSNPTQRQCLGCRTPIAADRICCAGCWRELPIILRMDVIRARRGSGAGLKAAQAVADWFRKAEAL